ncbi:multidrug ABC transporter ATP-binding protein [Wenjunlia tyrosinilytica]|uniref:Multidrug ABC transporter ATP-binding protein n=1 Tax=Wenjunlia tyrosinilytica TaxID=1544741 RepID=A0A917ZJK7_9ACTN|nr:multidrug ABC transporter ATP-binding protein [Wenjunlia tyrosinilytica]
MLVALQLVQATTALSLPTLSADIINKGVVRGDTHHIMYTGAAMGLLAVLELFSVIGTVFLGVRTAAAVGKDIRASVFQRVQSFSAREVSKFGAPSLITRTINDVLQVQMFLMMTFTSIVTAPVMLVGAIAMACSQDIPLAVLLLTIVPVLTLQASSIFRRSRPLFRVIQRRIDILNQVLREQLDGVRVIRAFVRDEHEQRRFERANDALTDVSLRAGRLTTLLYPLMFTTINAFSVLVAWYAARRIDSAGTEIGVLTAFLGYLMLILTSVATATSVFMMVPRASVSAERIQEVLHTESSVVPPLHPARRRQRRGVVEMRGASFRFPGAEAAVLRDIGMVARPGETTAVIGSTGVGKTTLLRLICRLLDVTSGQVLVDGEDVRNIDQAALTDLIGLVTQRPYFFSGTVASNLRHGRPNVTDEELWRALDVAQARGFVERLNGSLHSPIAQGGTNLSGGQRQRLAIARVLVRRPRIYLLDDSFSALDYTTEAALRAALARETADATRVIVAQRVGSIRDADRIVVLDSGIVVGTGTHNELMAGTPTYRELALSQQLSQEGAR